MIRPNILDLAEKVRTLSTMTLEELAEFTQQCADAKETMRRDAQGFVAASSNARKRFDALMKEGRFDEAMQVHMDLLKRS